MLASSAWSGQSQSVANQAWNGSVASSARTQITAAFTNGFTCSMSQGATTGSRMVTAGPTAGSIELQTFNATASFDYVFVVNMP
jgi:hypothetical protein